MRATNFRRVHMVQYHSIEVQFICGEIRSVTRNSTENPTKFHLLLAPIESVKQTTTRPDADEWLSKAIQSNANWHVAVIAYPLNSILAICYTHPSPWGVHSVYCYRVYLGRFHSLLCLSNLQNRSDRWSTETSLVSEKWRGRPRRRRRESPSREKRKWPNFQVLLDLRDRRAWIISSLQILQQMCRKVWSSLSLAQYVCRKSQLYVFFSDTG